ncbi:MAG: hypothetical protein RLO81_04080 [Fulvivirga sp.]|uniref:hypothetical protein n=1 Tax=Fulvivirga sp. TaxID=1931237 RepID=UPI0032F07671
MKPLASILALGLLLSFSSCFIGGDEGPIGPQGPRGPQGADGLDGEEAYVFEYENVSFTGPDYQVFLPYSDDFEALISDVTLVYFLWDVDTDGNEIWRALPQTVITENGLLQYNFDWTTLDVKLFLDADYELDLLTAMDTDNWFVRLVVVPGQFWSGGRKAHPSYEEVKERYGIEDSKISGNVMKRRSL